MPSEFRSAAIYHVLYADTVSYTRHSMDAKAAVDEALLSAVMARSEDESRVLTVDAGDGFFMAFEGDPQAACRAAINLRDELARRCSARVRLGVHSGVAVLRNDLKAGINMTGPAVEIAQRVMSLSSGQEIFVSDAMAAHLQEFDEWKQRLKRPRPLPAKGGSIVVWELDETESSTGVLLVAETGAPESATAQFQMAAGAAVAITASGEIADVADIARCAPHYEAVAIAAREDGLLRRALFESGSGRGWGMGFATKTERRWFAASDMDRFAEAFEKAVGAQEEPSAGDLYVERRADRQLREALTRGAGIVLVRAPRFSGKTSLLMRGLDHARRQGWKTVVTDFRAFDHSLLASGEDLYRAIARSFATQFGSPSGVNPEWKPELGPNTNLEAVIQSHLTASEGQTLWIWDSVERLFDGLYQDDLFGLLRSWHNRRAWDDQGVWPRVTIALAYSTDAERLIRNPNQSPFNVGARIDLTDFDLAEFKALHDLAGAPIIRTTELESAHALTGGDPYLSQLLLEGVSRGQLKVADLLENRWPESSGWGRHMTSLCEAAISDPEALSALRVICRKGRTDNPLAVLRLIHMGVLKPNLVQKPAFRSLAYERMFTRLLAR